MTAREHQVLKIVTCPYTEGSARRVITGMVSAEMNITTRVPPASDRH